ncbi:MAG: hypothetical protein B7Z07_01850 [Sphingomonadales bacterium 32-67-7]|nr:MAG: hypothetical protein B7Z07_01850 [Sphingomonadales bacterium 32-67-7]
MILAIMLGLAATTQAAPPSPPPGDDIVVIGERMKNLRIVMVRDRRTGISAVSGRSTRRPLWKRACGPL